MPAGTSGGCRDNRQRIGRDLAATRQRREAPERRSREYRGLGADGVGNAQAALREGIGGGIADTLLLVSVADEQAHASQFSANGNTRDGHRNNWYAAACRISDGEQDAMRNYPASRRR